MAETRTVSIPRLILVPALITLAVTLLRLIGELQKWSPSLFNREAGGGGALVGIVWLIPIFGVYFALKLAAAGDGPVSVGKALGWAALAFVLNTALGFGSFAVVKSPVAQLGIFTVTSWLAILAARPGWPALWRVLLAYGFAARIPVLVVMFLSIFGGWDTHYTKPRPDFPAMGPWGLFFWTALLPQLSVWIYLTVVGGLLFGALAVGLRRLMSRPAVVPAMILLLAVAGAARADDAADLHEAARKGDLARVRSLLDSGVKPDVEGRHGITALMIAAGDGQIEVARLLVERGADVNARERFFNSTVLANAARGKKAELVRWLLEKGSTDADSAMDFAVQTGDVALLRQALASGHLEPLDLLSYQKFVAAPDSKASAEVKAVLGTATVPRPARKPFTADPRRLAAYAGRYGGGDKPEVNVAVREGRLAVTVAGQPELTVAPFAPDQFENAAGDVVVFFYGRGGTIEGMGINRAGDVTRMGLATPAPQALPKAESAAAEKAARTAPRPWPTFRGEDASGVGDGQGAPLAWDVKTGENVRFKTKVPGLALSSPIVYGNRIFVTTAVGTKGGEETFRTGLYGDPDSVDDLSEHSYRLLALDTKTGAIVWDREVHRARPTVKRHLKSSQANATPATDGKTVYVLFGTVGVLAAYDFAGREVWRRDVGVLEANDPQAGAAQWGHASSPILYRDLVIVQADRVKDSFLAAFKAATGDPAWRVARDEPSTWSTPNVLRAASGDELITNGQKIRAYEPTTGKLLWTLGPNSEVVVATPVTAEGMALVTAGYPPVRPVYAVRAGQRGDLSLPDGQRRSAAIAWSHARGGTYIPTPLPYRGFLYTVNNNGILTAYRLSTGEQAFQTRLPMGSFSASPVAADGRLYFASETGEVHVLRAGADYQLLTTNAMDEIVMATPAISDGLLVVRTLKHVVGIAEGSRKERP